MNQNAPIKSETSLQREPQVRSSELVLRARELERALCELCDWINNEYAIHPAAFDQDTTPNAAWRTLVNPAIKEKAQNDQAEL